MKLTPSRARGSVLIVAMVVLFALAGLVLTLNRSARVDLALSANTQASHDADLIARGAEQYVLAILTDYRDSLDDMLETDFTNVPLGGGTFSIVKPNYDDGSLPAWGLMDESTKLNLNSATVDQLRILPGMTDELSAGIVDWRDVDDDVTASGSESANYLGQADGYRAKNANFEAVEELMLIKGMTPELLYGPPSMTGIVVGDYYQQHGLADFFTVWSREANTAADGTARVNINTQRTETRNLLRDKINEARAGEIVNRVGVSPAGDVFDYAFRGGITYDELRLIDDYITDAFPNTPVQGRINVNTAPREVLLTLNISESDVDALLARRTSEVQANPGSRAWVYDVLKEKSRGLGRRITGRGRQYSADIIASSRNGRAFKRVRIVVDTTPTTLRIVYRRDITDRGRPAVLDAQVPVQGARR